MPKCSAVGKLPVSTCAAYILCLIGIIQFFAFFGKYNYKHIPRESIENKLYKQVNPKLVPRKDVPECQYSDILRNTKSLNTWEVPHKFDYFSPNGIVNGSYAPEDCNPQLSVAILVTYRNRQKQLDIFLPYLHNFLRKQKIHYKIYLIEQQDDKAWNKGLLYNIGAKHAIADKFPCLILHDVDLLPLDEGNLYACLQQPRHLSASIDKFRFVLTYDWLVGGVLAIRTDQYIAVNGMSNSFHNWGGEDDNFYERLTEHNLEVLRFPRELSRYAMLVHRPEPRNEQRYTVMEEARRHSAADGLAAAQHTALRVVPHRLFTLIGINT